MAQESAQYLTAFGMSRACFRSAVHPSTWQMAIIAPFAESKAQQSQEAWV